MADPARGEFRIGPPQRLTLPATHNRIDHVGIDQDRSGRVAAVAGQQYAYVATSRGTIRVGPLDDCRSVAVSPDGQWLATGTHVASRGAQVWRIRDGEKVAELPIEHGTSVAFSPDGKWLVTTFPPRQVWKVGTWREETRITDVSGCFAPDGRTMAVVDPSRIIRLVEFATGRTLARLESPDLCGVANLAFSTDGSRLVVATQERPMPCVHVWDLRGIRKHPALKGLDWDAPAYPDDDPADPSAPPLPAPQVDFGSMTGHVKHLTENAGSLLQRATLSG